MSEELIFSHITDYRIDSIKTALLRQNSADLVDSVKLLYEVSVQYVNPKFHSLVRGNRYKEIEGKNVLGHVSCGYLNIKRNGLSPDTISARFITELAGDESSGPFGLIGKPFEILAPVDISQMYYDFNLIINFDGTDWQHDLQHLIDSTEIRIYFNFGGNTVFSSMYPQPDTVEYDAITFTDMEKIKTIMSYGGLQFHVELSDNKNIQTARIFFLTTILSMLLAYWLALVAKVFKHYYDKLEKEHDAEGNNDRLSSLDEK
jgi:hypothetical protein